MEKLTLACLTCGQGNRFAAADMGRGPKCSVCGAGLIPAHPVEIDGAILARAARIDGLPLIVDFWAPWCGPCRAMAPAFAQAARDLAGGLRFAKLNTEAHPAAAAQHGIRAIPTMIRFRNGRAERRQSGALGLAEIKAWAV